MGTLSATPFGSCKKGRKYGDVLRGARAVFLAMGYDSASMDEIARTAAVSKATLYSYFPDKRLLFLEVARLECEDLSDRALSLASQKAPPDLVLPMAAAHIVDFINSTVGMGIYRLCLAERDRFPELGQLYYRSGPSKARQGLIQYLTACTATGSLVIEDVPLAADQFIDLCKTDAFARHLFGLDPAPTPQQAQRIVAGAVAMFMARYGR